MFSYNLQIIARSLLRLRLFFISLDKIFLVNYRCLHVLSLNLFLYNYLETYWTFFP